MAISPKPTPPSLHSSLSCERDDPAARLARGKVSPLVPLPRNPTVSRVRGKFLTRMCGGSNGYGAFGTQIARVTESEDIG